jgi:hypothetical protein
MKKEKKKVGAKPKYKENVVTETLHVLIPSVLKQECLKAIEKIVEPALNK